MFKHTLIILAIIVSISVYGQDKGRKVIQFSGVVVSGDSLLPMPYSNIMVKNSYHGTISDFYGFFSFVAQTRDTIVFSSVGYQKSIFVIPENLEENRYSLIQMMQRDTFLLQETVIFPWPTREQFKEAFLKMDIPDDDLERARKNLAQESMRESGMKMPMDGSMNYRNTMQNYQSQLYTTGQIPTNSLLNPIAWSKFIQSWKNGDFKRKN
jgi:hypothetical protein